METTRDRAAPADRAHAIANEYRAAAERIEAAAARLNRRSSGCASCGRKEFEDFREANAAEAAYGMVKKLRRWAEALEHPGDYTVRGARRDRFDDDDEGHHHAHDNGAEGGR